MIAHDKRSLADDIASTAAQPFSSAIGSSSWSADFSPPRRLHGNDCGLD
jgi:hypothetical protein